MFAVRRCFEERNMHFHVSRCGFRIAALYKSHHPDPNDPETAERMDEQLPGGSSGKRMKQPESVQ